MSDLKTLVREKYGEAAPVADEPVPATPNALRSPGTSYATAQPPLNAARLGTASARPAVTGAIGAHDARFAAARHSVR